MKKNIINWIAILTSLLPFAYLAFIWNSLPDIVPVHFDLQMKPDRMGNKSELWIVTGILAGVSICIYFLMINIHRIDPKRKDETQSGTFNKLAFGLVIFLAALNSIIISSAKGNLILQNLLFPLVGLLFAFLGNYINNIKPNYFAGIRLPWTLSDDENWRRTHHLAGKLWFSGGLLIAIISLLLPLRVVVTFFIAATVILVLIPAIYSYRFFKKQTR
jgi:uncharacterized membrane protein